MKKSPSGRIRVILVTLAASLVAGVGLFVWSATRKVYEMPSTSMEPTIPAGARLVVDLSAYSNRAPRVGDVVVFRAPFDETQEMVKRVAAIGPVEVDMLPDGTFVVDQESVGRTRIDDVTFEEKAGPRRYRVRWPDPDFRPSYPPGPWPVMDGKIFLLGDNRQDSHDSRFWGPIDRDAIVGRVTHVYAGSAPRAVD